MFSMVGATKLRKILHCKFRKKRKSYDQVCSGEIVFADPCLKDKYKSPVKKELEVNVPLTHTCRVCIKQGSIPIFGGDTSENISEDFALVTSIKIDQHDELPKFLCYSCHSLLQGAILLKKTALQSDIQLRNLTEPPEAVAFDYDNDYSLDDPTCEPKIKPKKKLLKLKKENKTKAVYKSEEPKYDEGMSVYEPIVEPKIEPIEINYHCGRCDLNFNSFQEYNDHRMSEEHETKKNQCPYCHKFYNAVYFKRHLAIHEGDTPFICDICGKTFINQGHFTRHRLTHFYKLPYKCSLCPYRGRFTESLKMHMRSHTGEKPYQCSQCPARFISKSNLNKHSLIHKEDHDFKCEICGRGFYKQRDLDTHFKVDHTGIKDHVCNICGKAFGYRKQMMKHQLKVHKRAKLRSGRMPLYLQVEAKQIPIDE